MVYTHADFIMTSVSWTIPSKIYSRDLGSCRDHKKQGSVRKFVFGVTPDWARRASRAGGNGLVSHCRLPREGRQAGPKPEPPRDSPPASLARRPRSGSADRTRQHRRSLASEEHICGLTRPRTPRRHTVSTASPNRPGATSKAEQAAATPGGCCHKRLPTPSVTLPNVPGRAPWSLSTDNKPSSNNQSTPRATSILKSRRRG